MIDCLNVARYFIVRAYEDGIQAEMTNMKVQKLLYYAQSLHLALYDEPLFNDEIQAWQIQLLFNHQLSSIKEKCVDGSTLFSIMYLVNTTDFTITPLWIYSHDQFAKRPPDRDINRAIAEMLDS